MAYHAWSYGLALVVVAMVLLYRPLAWRVGMVSTMPWQVYRLATDPKLRRNHALEHATLNVLTERFGRFELRGTAIGIGFVLRGWINPEHVAKAAQEGLLRLRSGERHLAYHPSCGTSIGTAEFVAWLVLGLALLFTGRLTPVSLLLLLGATWLVGPWLGRLVQRKMTTSADVGDLAIAGVTFKPVTPARAAPPIPGTFWGEAVVLTDQLEIEPVTVSGRKRRSWRGS